MVREKAHSQARSILPLSTAQRESPLNWPKMPRQCMAVLRNRWLHWVPKSFASDVSLVGTWPWLWSQATR